MVLLSPASRVGQNRLLHRRRPCRLAPTSVRGGVSMAEWSVLAGLGLIVALGGCGSGRRSAMVAYTAPGWYLERPRFLVVTGPEIFAGPFTYEQCEAERTKFDDDAARRLICIL